LCSSYLTGMELPGECAAYSGLRAEIFPGSPGLPSDFEIALIDYDERFGLVQSRFALRGAFGVYARGEIGAISIPPIIRSGSTIPRAGLGSLAGKTAVLIGASRGLGAAMSLELAAEGCTVLGVYSRSGEEAEAVAQASRALPGCVVMRQGDASDPSWCSALKDQIKAEYGRLDLLICSAAPSIQPLRVEEAHYARIQTYLQKGFALVGVPLSSLLELISASEGGVLLISSAAVESAPGIWPHYVALKSAVEGLLRAVAADHPKVRFWVARPSKIETDLINTPMGRLDAEKPATVARRILAHMTANATPGTLHFCG
jgi:NAD(P)-dependent dehydrogenase (short-subunit alcohol dehydrogenase family)